MHVFDVEYRERVRERILALAPTDARIVAGAVVGSLANDGGDRWSDLDLTFGVADDVTVGDVLCDWTDVLAREFDAAALFDLTAGSSLYRVFLLPGCLQVDLSFTPASDFGARTPRFQLLFGTATERAHLATPDANDLFGRAVHHALRARFSIERRRYWQAEYWVSAARDCALELACHSRDLPARYGRGFDDLPADVHDAFEGAIVRSLDGEELLRALGVTISGLLRGAGAARDLATKVEPQLLALTAAWGRGS